MNKLLTILAFAAVALWSYNYGTVEAMVSETNASTTAREAAGATISVEVKPALEVTETPTGERFDDVQPQAKAPQ